MLYRFGSSKGRKGGFIFVDPRRVASWQRLIAQIVWFCLWGKGISVLPLFLPLTFKPVYGMLVDVVLCYNLQCLKVCCQLCCPNLQLRTMNCDALHAQRFWENLPAPLLAFLWFFYFQIQGLEIKWGNILNAVPQTRFTDIHKLIILFFDILPHFHDQITRNEMSLMNT